MRVRERKGERGCGKPGGREPVAVVVHGGRRTLGVVVGLAEGDRAKRRIISVQPPTAFLTMFEALARFDPCCPAPPPVPGVQSIHSMLYAHNKTRFLGLRRGVASLVPFFPLFVHGRPLAENLPHFAYR